MSIRQDIGPVSAYALAKEKGYQGTEEEFEQAMADVGTNISEIKEAIDTFNNVTVPTATQAVTDEGIEQVGLVNAAGTAQVNAVEEKGTIEIAAVEAAGTTQVGAVNSAGSAQVTAVETAGSTQTAAVNVAGTTQVGNVNTAGGTQVAAVQAKGEEVIASIPADYSELTQEVSDLNQAINSVIDGNESVTQIYQNRYDTDGSVKGSDSRIRTDIFQLNENDTVQIENVAMQYTIYTWETVISSETNHATSWLSGDRVFTMSFDGYLAIVFKNNDQTITPADFSGTITIHRMANLHDLVAENEEQNSRLITLENQLTDQNKVYEFINATVNTNGQFVSNSSRAAANTIIHGEGGATVTITNGDYLHVCVIWKGTVDSSHIIRNDSSFRNSNEIVELNKDEYLAVVFKKTDGSTLNINDFNGSVTAVLYAELTHEIAMLMPLFLNQNLKVLAIGDSRTDKNAYLGNNNVITLLANKYGWNADNIAKSGTGFLRRNSGQNDSLVDIVSTIGQDYDLIYINIGVNDFYFSSAPLGTEADTQPTTIYGAIDYCFSTIVSRNPLAKIFVQLPLPKVNARTNNAEGWNMDDLAEALKNVAEKYFLYVDDLYHHGCFYVFNNDFVQTYTYNGDGLHPTVEWVKDFLLPHTDSALKML